MNAKLFLALSFLVAAVSADFLSLRRLTAERAGPIALPASEGSGAEPGGLQSLCYLGTVKDHLGRLVRLYRPCAVDPLRDAETEMTLA